MSIHELQMPVMKDGDRMAYGGDQEWCRLLWQRRSGCAPTTAANLSAYYASTRPAMRALYAGEIVPFDKEGYTDCIEELFRLITPGPAGYPFADKFLDRYCRYAAGKGVALSGISCSAAGTAEQVFDFVRSSIDADHPLALMVLRHRAPEMEEDTWHWVTVSGYLDGNDGRQIIVSNCGDRQLWSADVVFERHPGNYVRVLHFRESITG